MTSDVVLAQDMAKLPASYLTTMLLSSISMRISRPYKMMSNFDLHLLEL